MPYCEVMSTRTYYEVSGPEGATPMIMIHGAAQDTLSWRFNAPHFSGRYRVYVIDLPGHGKSAKLGGRPVSETKVYAEFVWAFMAVLGITRPIAVGHSLSGGLVLLLAAQGSDKLRAVVPVDGAAETGKVFHSDIFDISSIAPQSWTELSFRALCSRFTPPERVADMVQDPQRCQPDVVFEDLRCYTTLHVRDRLNDIRCPVLFIQGADDWSLRPEMSKETQGLIHNAPTAYRLLTKTGHFPHTENPEAFNRVLDELLIEFAL